MGGRPAALSYSNTAGRHSCRHVRPAIVGRAETGFHARSPGSPPRLAARLALLIDTCRVASGCVGNAARFGHRPGGLCAVRPDASEPFSSSIVVAPSPAALFPAAILDADGTASSARRSPPKPDPPAALAARAAFSGAAYVAPWPHVGAARAYTVRRSANSRAAPFAAQTRRVGGSRAATHTARPKNHNMRPNVGTDPVAWISCGGLAESA